MSEDNYSSREKVVNRFEEQPRITSKLLFSHDTQTTKPNRNTVKLRKAVLPNHPETVQAELQAMHGTGRGSLHSR
jgi:hypothetical protein